MNFDELQQQWQKEEVSAPEISLEHQHKINNPLDKIRKNMKMEFWSNFATFILILIFLFMLENIKVKTYAIILTITSILVSVFYYLKFFSLYKEISCQNINTKDSLKNLMHQFELNKQYYVSYYVAFVPIMVCAYIIMFEYMPTYQQHNDFVFILLFGFTVVFAILFLYLVGKWWFNYFYGKYINQIENILIELK
jgi:hypothetical protein